MLTSDWQPTKGHSPNEVTLDEMETDLRRGQKAKACSPIAVTPTGMLMDSRPSVP